MGYNYSTFCKEYTVSVLLNFESNSFDFGSTKLFGKPITIGGMAGDQQSATIGQACFNKGQST